MLMNRKKNKNICLICKNMDKNQISCGVVISPWIREMAKINDSLSKYSFCNNCNIGYFTRRYTNYEMNMIYKDYRGTKYFETRNKWEKWYDKEFFTNESSSSFALERKSMIEDFIVSKINYKIETVLDVGGDKGQYIPNFENTTKRYVVDPSNRELAHGVQRLNTLEDIEKCDLILYSHVLEHVSFPLQEVVNLLRKCKSLYIEVPYGKPRINLARRLGIFVPFILILSKFPKLYSKFTAPNAGRLNNRNLWLNQSEHINFFEENSFRFIAEINNKNLECIVSEIPTPDGKKAKVIQVLFQ
jgi:hypothetical protein